jgi:hypothetical protein
VPEDTATGRANAPGDHAHRRSRRGVLFLAPLAAAIIIAFVPGLMIPDTLDMCSQALAGHYTTWHSAIFAGAWGFLRLSPGTIFVGQILSFVVGLYFLLSRLLRPWFAVAATYVITLFPTTLDWLPHIGKDEWASIALLWAIVLIARSRTAPRPRSVIYLGGALAFLWLSAAARTTAVVPAAAILAFGISLERWGWLGRVKVWAPLKRLAIVVVFVAVTIGSQKVWTSEVVQPRVLYPDQPTLQFDLAAMSLRANEMLLPPSSLRPGATLDTLRSHFSLRGGDPLWFAPDAPIRFDITDPKAESDLRSAWISAVRDHPDLYLRHRGAVALALLGISAPYAEGEIWHSGSSPSDFPGTVCHLGRPYVSSVFDTVSDTMQSISRWHVWRVWWMLAITGGAAVVAGPRRFAEVRMLLVGGLTTFAVFAMLTTGPYFRYLWFVDIAALSLVALAFVRVPRLARAPSTSELVTGVDSIVVEHADRGERELLGISADSTELGEEIMGQRDHVATHRVGLEDVQQLARARPDQLQSLELAEDVDGGGHQGHRIDTGVGDPPGEE